MRRVDRNPSLAHVLFHQILSGTKLAVERGLVTKNVGRLILFVNDADYRTKVVSLLSLDPVVDAETADAKCKQWGLTFHSKVAVPVVDANDTIVAYIVGTGNNPEAESETSGRSLVRM